MPVVTEFIKKWGYLLTRKYGTPALSESDLKEFVNDLKTLTKVTSDNFSQVMQLIMEMLENEGHSATLEILKLIEPYKKYITKENQEKYADRF